MNYKLAKQLKDAGFPQKPTKLNKYPLYCAEMSMPWKYGVNKTPEGTSEYSKIPTLSELIEACGTAMKVLRQTGKIWIAWDDNFALNEWNNKSATGDTPIIAVAKLYLKLNEKQLLSH